MSNVPDYAKLLEDKLAEDLISRGYRVIQNQKFNIDKLDGECDVIAFRPESYQDNYVLIFEVKRRDNPRSRRKSLEQLRKDNRFVRRKFGKNKRCFNFLAYSSNEYETSQTNQAYTIEWIRGL